MEKTKQQLSSWDVMYINILLVQKTYKNLKNWLWVALKCMETRKSQPCPLHTGWALAKSNGDLFYTPKSLPHFLLLAKFSSDSKAMI